MIICKPKTLKEITAELDALYKPGEFYKVPMFASNSQVQNELRTQFVGKVGGGTKYQFKAVPGGWTLTFSATQLYFKDKKIRSKK